MDFDAFAASLGAERITVYRVDGDGESISSVHQSGLEAFKAIRLPLTLDSVAGYVAIHRRTVNVADVRDAAALAKLDPPLAWFPQIDLRTGFRTRELLCAPVLDAQGRLLGVVELLNRVDGTPFPAASEAALAAWSGTLARDWAEPIGSALRDLAALPERALRPGAPREEAGAREALLLRLRGLAMGGAAAVFMQPIARWSEEEFTLFEWICRLAAGGHRGAARLRDRALMFDDKMGGRYQRYNGFDPEARATHRLTALAGIDPAVATAFACLADISSITSDPGSEEALRWLEMAGAAGKASAALMRSRYAANPEWARREASLVAKHIARLIDLRMSHPPEVAVEELALAFAAEEARHEMEAADVERARREHEWIQRYRKATDKASVARELLDSGTTPQQVGEWRAVLVGSALERGLDGRGSDLASALRWYARVSGLEKLAGGEESIDGSACRILAEQLDQLCDEPAMAVAWLERGIARGNLTCLHEWLSGCLEGDVGLRGRLSEAPRLIASLRAAGIEPRMPEWPVESQVFKKACAAIEQGIDPGAWKPWLELMADLGSTRARMLLDARLEEVAPASRPARIATLREEIETRVKTDGMLRTIAEWVVSGDADELKLGAAALVRIAGQGTPAQREEAHRLQALIAARAAAVSKAS